jgi:hypothetical protein
MATIKIKNHGSQILVTDSNVVRDVQGNTKCNEEYPFLKDVPMFNIDPTGKVGILPLKKGTKMAEVFLGLPNGTKVPVELTNKEIVGADDKIYYRARLISSYFTAIKAKADK